VKTLKAIFAAGALASLLTLTLSGPVLANGVGDLYVASSVGVLEVHVKTSTVVSTIPVVPSPQALAFSPDGRTLYAASANSKVTPVDIATLDVQTAISMPGNIAALAFPAGQVLVGAMPLRRTLAFAVVHGGAVTESAELPGSGNLLAGDRREARVAVAEAGKDWLAVVDPGTNTIRKATLTGGIVAMAIERDRGAVLVATQNPNALLRVDLTSMATTWTVQLDATPVAVAATSTGAVVAGGTQLWSVDGKTATAMATARQAVLAVNVSDDGTVIHVAEATGIEVFDVKGNLQRTLELKDDRAPIAMAAVPSGSSLYLGEGGAGATAKATATARSSAAPALATAEPPTTSTIVDTAKSFAAQTPVQGAAIVFAAVLLCCWLLIRWSDRRKTRAR
jgi:hypothetical protein